MKNPKPRITDDPLVIIFIAIVGYVVIYLITETLVLNFIMPQVLNTDGTINPEKVRILFNLALGITTTTLYTILGIIIFRIFKKLKKCFRIQ